MTSSSITTRELASVDASGDIAICCAANVLDSTPTQVYLGQAGDSHYQGADDAAAFSGAYSACEWTILLPFHNEREYLPATLASLAEQTRSFKLILIDNGSTGDSQAIARSALRALNLGAVIITERRPGKVGALAAGLAHVDTSFVATCDADCWYPARYLEQAYRLLSSENGRQHAAAAYFIPRQASRLQRFTQTVHKRLATYCLPWQCHSGGAGQVFRTSSLRSAGGFCTERWNFVLEDHEIAHRMAEFGPISYSPEFYCSPSDRKRLRQPARWSFSERVRYHVTPRSRQPDFFYGYLARRFTQRKLYSYKLRENAA